MHLLATAILFHLDNTLLILMIFIAGSLCSQFVPYVYASIFLELFVFPTCFIHDTT